MRSEPQKLAVMLDPRGIIGKGGLSVISRHNKYSEMLGSRTHGEKTLIVLTLVPRGTPASQLPATIVSFTSRITWILGSVRFLLNNRSRIYLFVTGNPWESFWVTWLLKNLSCIRARLQVQFHGDFCDVKWKSMSWKNKLRFKSLPLVVGLCDDVRFVGKVQYLNTTKMFPSLRDRSVLAPIPFHLGEFQVQPFDPHDHFTIGIVGRIHKDKGIDNTLRFIHCLSLSEYSFSVIFVGEGPERPRVTSTLDALEVDFHITGHVMGDELEIAWHSIDVVLSMAPVESFGLVLREALARGKRVVATLNGGVIELQSELPAKHGLEILSEDWDCDSVRGAIELLKSHKPRPEIRDFLARQANDSLERLIESWI
jgi:glycosyltransferase involved in cell wall biosynthesis